MLTVCGNEWRHACMSIQRNVCPYHIMLSTNSSPSHKMPMCNVLGSSEVPLLYEVQFISLCVYLIYHNVCYVYIENCIHVWVTEGIFCNKNIHWLVMTIHSQCCLKPTSSLHHGPFLTSAERKHITSLVVHRVVLQAIARCCDKRRQVHTYINE